MFNDPLNIQAIKDACPAEALFDALGIKFKHTSGGRLAACCPFHNERTPSFFYHSRGRYAGQMHCFGCNWHGDAISLVQQHQGVSFLDALAIVDEIAGGRAIARSLNRANTPQEARKPALQPAYFSTEDVIKSWENNRQNTLYRFLASRFGDERVAEVFRLYEVGSALGEWTGAFAPFAPLDADGASTVFWTVGSDQRAYQRKLMGYHPDGHRARIHSADASRAAAVKITFADRERRPEVIPMFGSQLLDAQRYPHLANARVNVVESEKTALTAACYYGDYLGIWLATGGMKRLYGTVVAQESDLCGRYIAIIPDSDATTWHDDAQRLLSEGWDILDMSSMWPALSIAPDSKTDLADVILD